MKKLEQTIGMKAQLAFEMLYGAKPSLKGRTITGKLVLVGYGHDKIDERFDYINLSKDRDIINHLANVDQQGLYIKICEGVNDTEIPIGEMVFIKKVFDYLGNSDWSQLNVINLIMNQLGNKPFEWYGQISDKDKEKTILPYMAISVEPDFKNREFFICEAAEFLIEEYMGTKKKEPAMTK